MGGISTKPASELKPCDFNQLSGWFRCSLEATTQLLGKAMILSYILVCSRLFTSIRPLWLQARAVSLGRTPAASPR